MSTIAWRDLKRRLKRGEIGIEEALCSPACAGRLTLEVVALALLAGSDRSDHHHQDAPALLAAAGVHYAALAHDLSPAVRGQLGRLTRPQRAATPTAV